MDVDISRIGIEPETLDQKIREAEKALALIMSGTKDMTGWVGAPIHRHRDELERIEKIANEIQRSCELCVVLGIGGSSLGAKAVLDALCGRQDTPTQIIFAGDSLDACALKRVKDQIQKKSCCLCVISKSGTTMETLIAFSILKETMKEKYGQQAAARIYAVTDGAQGALREEALREGYVSFEIPRDVGGRYSVLTAVGLFPLAVGGVDIHQLLDGAESIAADAEGCYDAARYAAARVCLYESGKQIEAFESFDPALETFGKWLQQLFGESEGKQGRGLFPTVLTFTRDLHSMGQFLQEGTPIVFETMILFDKARDQVVAPPTAGQALAGLTVDQVNNCVAKGVASAHAEAGIPLVAVSQPTKDLFSMGQLIYFFQLAASVSATLMGVEPFDQPGVERYKREAWDEIDELRRKV
jgi:glucose-6-phosphate isomerase